MSKSKTQEEYLSQLKDIYGDRYDLSGVRYVNSETKVVVRCPIHGYFTPKASSLLEGHGCKKCGYEKRAKMQKGRKCKPRTRYGVGLCDDITVDENGNILKSYAAWANILLRCYSKAYHNRQPSYIGCQICEEWKKYSVFKKWYDDNAKEGFQLDKDLVSPKEKIYSPNTCSFVPVLINHIISRCGKEDKGRGKYGIGVYVDDRKNIKNKYFTSVTEYGRNKYVGSFKTKEEAYLAYKREKERYVKEVAQDYYNKGLITEKVFSALMNYEVEITD